MKRTEVRGLGIVLSVAVLLLMARIAAADTRTLKITGVSNAPALNTRVMIDIEGLPEWIQDGGEADHDPKRALLYLNGQPIPDKHPLVSRESSQLRFDLRREDTDKSKAAWAFVLGRPELGFRRPMSLSVGFEDGTMMTTEYPIEFVVFQEGWSLWMALGLFVCAVVLFAWLASVSDVLRDTAPPPVEGKRKPFSLGRTQMAFWFFLSMGAYLLIWLVTGDRNAMPSSVLGLMGISASTALGAALIDFGKREGAESDLKARRAERETLQTRLAQLTALAMLTTEEQRELADKTGRQKEVVEEIKRLEAASVGGQTSGFVNDIVRDADGSVSLHRFQIIVWTLVLGLVFGAEVYRNLAMPEFSGTLLALMGISSGTYLGFKWPEKPAT